MLPLLLTSPRLCHSHCPHLPIIVFTILHSPRFWLPGSCTFLHMRSHAGMYQILCDDAEQVGSASTVFPCKAWKLVALTKGAADQACGQWRATLSRKMRRKLHWTWVLVALLYLCCLIQIVTSDGMFGKAGRLADEDIERIADRLGERYVPCHLAV